jgi:hypothetical protein
MDDGGGKCACRHCMGVHQHHVYNPRRVRFSEGLNLGCAAHRGPWWCLCRYQELARSEGHVTELYSGSQSLVYLVSVRVPHAQTWSTILPNQAGADAPWTTEFVVAFINRHQLGTQHCGGGEMSKEHYLSHMTVETRTPPCRSDISWPGRPEIHDKALLKTMTPPAPPHLAQWPIRCSRSCER